MPERTVTIRFRDRDRLDLLIRKTEAEGPAEVIGNALRLYEALIAETDAGNTWIVRHPDGSQRPFSMWDIGSV